MLLVPIRVLLALKTAVRAPSDVTGLRERR